MIELDKAHASLGQPAGHQAIVGEAGFARFGAISSQHGGGLLADVHGVGGLHLHAERHLVLSNPGDGFGIAELGIGLLVDLVHRVQHAAAQWPADILRGFQIEHRLAVRAALHALVNAGQEARTPQLLAAIRRLPPDIRTMKPGRFWFSVPSP